MAATVSAPAAPESPRAEPGPPPAAREEGASGRLVSLDAFRGLTILGMLLVNNVTLGAATPRPLTHADWSGRVHLADLVFPWFLFIVGVAIPWARASHRRKGLGAGRRALKASGRALGLVLLGCLVTSAVARQPVLGLGVLQVIGLAYLVAALAAGLPAPARAVLAGLLLAGHWALLRFVPFPGGPAGSFTESQNVIAYLNRAYLAPWHLAGLVSVVPTAALALLGTVCGDALRERRYAPGRKIGGLITGGLLAVALGALWSRDLPMNKPLWTAPYILFTGGWAAAALGALYAVFDARGWRRWALPLVVPGMNAIVAYVAPILVKTMVLQHWTWPMPDGARPTLEQALQQACFAQAGRYAGGWLYTLGYLLFWWLVLLYLYRKRIFLRV
uniref:N-acetylglucosamine related transporter, NagX n=1 Tax=uncultured Armatimonadetes bacterium TaxID=157466 RepID=A0A6J4IGN8_9BACT|nr:N-acetylglucosamine related transporter, NagX [uncultured Armatimonadetes bacterium]